MSTGSADSRRVSFAALAKQFDALAGDLDDLTAEWRDEPGHDDDHDALLAVEDVAIDASDAAETLSALAKASSRV